MTTPTEENILKGKKDRTWDNVKDSDIIEMPLGLYKLAISKSKQEGYQLAQKEEIENLKEIELRIARHNYALAGNMCLERIKELINKEAEEE